MSIQIITTADGSHTIKHSELEETYHSIHGAIQESRHVFIEAGLNHLLKQDHREISLLEIGFGTGLNAYLSLLNQQYAAIEYTAIESQPLPKIIYSKLNYAHELKSDPKTFLALHQSQWENWESITNRFSLYKMRGKLENVELMVNRYDLVYYDAFAPEKQSEMWEFPILEKVVKSMKNGGVLVSYCTKGAFKRNLRALGLNVKRLPGPPKKFQMVRATVA